MRTREQGWDELDFEGGERPSRRPAPGRSSLAAAYAGVGVAEEAPQSPAGQGYLLGSGGVSAEVARSGLEGSPSRLPMQGEMEQAFGTSFSHIRAFTGDSAASANRALGSEAFTVGNSIAFGTSSPTKPVIAHELAHTIQQQGGAATPQTLTLGATGDSYESEADRAVAAVMAGQTPVVSQRVSPSIQRWASHEHMQFGQEGERRARAAVQQGTGRGGAKAAPALPSTDVETADGPISYGHSSELSGDFLPNQRTLAESTAPNREFPTIAGETLNSVIVATTNLNHFHPICQAEYRQHHQAALQHAAAGDNAGAIRSESFASHFLQDTFAAGHMVPRALDRLGAGSSRAGEAASGLFRSKSFHNRLNELPAGIPTTLGYRVHGDGTADGGDLEVCAAATASSLGEVLGVLGGVSVPGDVQLPAPDVGAILAEEEAGTIWHEMQGVYARDLRTAGDGDEDIRTDGGTVVDRRVAIRGIERGIYGRDSKSEPSPSPSWAGGGEPAAATPQDRSHKLDLKHAGGAAYPQTPAQQRQAVAYATLGTPSRVPYQGEMEQRFGARLDHVEAYTGAYAKTATQSLGAEAATSGNAIFFRESSPDRALVAHELTHVFQQAGAANAPTAAMSTRSDPAEREAEAVEQAVASGQQVPAIGATTMGAAVLRKEVAATPLDPGRQTYAHGGYMGLAGSFMKDAQWTGIFSQIQPTTKTECDDLVRANDTAGLMGKLENNPVLAAYGTVRSGSAEADAAPAGDVALEWDVWLNDEDPGNLSRALIVHGNKYASASSLVPAANRRVYQHANPITDVAGAGNVDEWMRDYGLAINLARGASPGGGAGPGGEPAAAPAGQQDVESAVASSREILSRVGVYLDIKSADSTSAQINTFIRALHQAHDVRVLGVGSFSDAQVEGLEPGVRGIRFVHSQDGLLNAVDAGEIGDGDSVMFNGGALLREEAGDFSLDRAALERVRGVQQAHRLQLGIYVQESAISPAANALLIDLINRETALFQLGFAYGSVSGRTEDAVSGRGTGSQDTPITGESAVRAVSDAPGQLEDLVLQAEALVRREAASASREVDRRGQELARRLEEAQRTAGAVYQDGRQRAGELVDEGARAAGDAYQQGAAVVEEGRQELLDRAARARQALSRMFGR